jgi:hypothetical protein
MHKLRVPASRFTTLIAAERRGLQSHARVPFAGRRCARAPAVAPSAHGRARVCDGDPWPKIHGVRPHRAAARPPAADPRLPCSPTLAPSFWSSPLSGSPLTSRWLGSCTVVPHFRRAHVRHRVNIVVAVLSMAAGAWQGTTAQREQPGLLADQPRRKEASARLAHRGCLQNWPAPATFVLSESGSLPASRAGARRRERVPSNATAAGESLDGGLRAGTSRSAATRALRPSRMRPTTAAAVGGGCH